MALRHFRRALLHWPPDVLRPELSFRKVISRRVGMEESGQDSKRPSLDPDMSGNLEQANALFSFLENRYSKRVRHHSQTGFYPYSCPIVSPFLEYYETKVQSIIL